MKIFGFVTAAIVLGGTAWLAVQVNDRSLPYTDVKVKLLPTPIEQSEIINIEVSIFYRRSCEGIIKRNFYDAKGTAWFIPPLPINNEPGQHISHSVAGISPLMPVGPARYVSRPEYYCNWFQKVFWPIYAPERSSSFEVIPAKTANTGKKGEKGDAGPRGDKGDKGDIGPYGPEGALGSNSNGTKETSYK